MNAHHNDPYNFIDDPEDFPVSHLTPTRIQGHQHPNKYHPDLQCTHVWRIKLPHVYRNEYAHLHKTCKVQCKNSKCKQRHRKSFWDHHNKNTPPNIIILLWISYYTPQNPQKSQAELKHYNQFTIIRT